MQRNVIILKTFTGIRNNKYTLVEPWIAKGGEGEIYSISQNKNLVAKLLLNPSSEKEAKLKFMISNGPKGNQLDYIAWPIDIIYDRLKRFCGFVMKRIQASDDLNIIYLPPDKFSKYPDIPWKNKITLAKNLCSVVYAVHQAGHIIGDFNPKNISVDISTLKVMLMDTDSFHIDAGTKFYRCNVHMPEYVPSELQGINFTKNPLPTYTFESDYFALAIHIFQLLMNGGHPFTMKAIPGKSSIVQAPSQNENIKYGRSAFFQLINGVNIPSYSPPVIIFPDTFYDLFSRAFIKGKSNPSLRPNEKEWYDALTSLEKKLTQCKKVKFHQYTSNNQDCPWCKLDQKYNRIIVSKPIRKKPVQQTQSVVNNYVSPPPLILPKNKKISNSEKFFTHLIRGIFVGIAGLLTSMLIFGIFGLFGQGLIGLWLGLGEGFLFFFRLIGFVWDAVVFLWNGLWFVLGAVWDGLVWFFELLFSRIVPSLLIKQWTSYIR